MGKKSKKPEPVKEEISSEEEEESMEKMEEIGESAEEDMMGEEGE
jgi:hypothetical protein